MPIPIPGIQHTKTVLALTAIEAAVEQMLPFITDKKTTDQIAKVRKWVDLCSAATKVKRLSSGAKRDLESACAVLAPYIEDTAGMTDAETDKTADLCLTLAGRHSVVVVEHDMEFVAKIAGDQGKVTVLHEGSVLAEGPMRSVRTNPKVIEVYLGR